MSAACRKSFRQLLLFSTALAIIAGSGAARAQSVSQAPAPTLRGPTGDNSAATASPQSSTSSSTAQPASQGSGSTSTGGPTLSGFQLDARAMAEESYVSNAAGVPGSSQSDYLSTLGLSSDVHEHSARVSLDANYNFFSDFYARGTVPTQISNYLQAVGTLDMIPQHLDLQVRAFAQPVVASNFGVTTAGDRVIPGAFRNAYGYFETPDLLFKLGDFASFKTMPSVGQVFFSTPAGTSTINTIPEIAGPENTTLRSITEQISSGTEFSQLNWSLVGLFSETDRRQSLLSEKTGIADMRYALSHAWYLLATGGYDSIQNTIALTHNISGPVALGGFGATVGQNFSFQGEAGERYNSLSFNGNLRYNLGPTSLISASANDYVQTPEGQLLNNLTNLTALSDGTLTSADQIFGNGAAASFGSFNVQSPDNPSLDQIISRYQIVALSFSEEWVRTKGSVSLFGTRRTLLTAGFPGSPVVESWGSQILASRNLSRLLSATVGATYTDNYEFGGRASTIMAQAELQYSLSEATMVFVRANYIDRISSDSLAAVSPLSGTVTDFRATLGISHAL